MSDRGRYDSAMFWLAFGTAAAVIGLALMTIGVSRSSTSADLLRSPWFDGGLVLLGLGGLMLVWALGLYMARRRASGPAKDDDSKSAAETALVEAIRGHYAEREKLFKLYEKQDKAKRNKN